MNEKDDFMDLLSLASNDSHQDTDNKNDENIEIQLSEELTDDELHRIALTEILKTIGSNNEVIQELKDMVIMGADAEFAQAFASIAKANSDAIKVISEIALQKEKLKVQKEIKKIDIEGKKEINEHKHDLEMRDGGKRGNNTNVLIMNREEVFRTLFGNNNNRSERDVTPSAPLIEAES